MVFDSFRRALSGDRGKEEVEAELRRLDEELERHKMLLEEGRRSRLAALFPQGPVPGAGAGRFPDLDPMNFEEDEEESWLVAIATRIIDNFPGGETLLSQLDDTLLAFSEANHYRVVAGDPHDRLLGFRDEVLAAFDLEVEVPIYVARGGGCRVEGCSRPFAVIDLVALEGLDEEEQRFVLATTLGHVFFGNLRIFSFHRLMETLDKLPSMTGLITRGLGLIPVFGTTISRGLEIARSVNDQLIRKTNLVVGMRQKVLCDRLATLVLGSGETAKRVLARLVLGDSDKAFQDRLVEQGRAIQERLRAGEVDLHMLSIVGPGAPFAAWRSFKLQAWLEDETFTRLKDGFYVTRARLREYRRTHRTLEEKLEEHGKRLTGLLERRVKLEEELHALAAKEAGGSAGKEGAR